MPAGTLCTALTFVDMDGAFVLEDRRYTEDEWIALEEELDTKFEYLDGYLFDIRAMNEASAEVRMAGGSLAHGQACANAAGVLRDACRSTGRGCFAFTSEVKIQVSRYKRYYYPDASVRCEKVERGDKAGTYKNPTLVLEVVSDSSYQRDTLTKFAHYPSLASLRDYVLVFLKTPAVHVFSRDAAGEPMTVNTYHGLEEVVSFPSLRASVTMRDLYEEVEFPPEAKVVSIHNSNQQDGES